MGASGTRKGWRDEEEQARRFREEARRSGGFALCKPKPPDRPGLPGPIPTPKPIPTPWEPIRPPEPPKPFPPLPPKAGLLCAFAAAGTSPDRLFASFTLTLAGPADEVTRARKAAEALARSLNLHLRPLHCSPLRDLPKPPPPVIPLPKPLPEPAFPSP